VFLWVRLVCDELENFATRGCTEKHIFDFLKSLPTELDKFYERILHNMGDGTEKDVVDGIKMFRFVLFSGRPLTVSELQHALAIPDDSDTDLGSILSIESFNRDIIIGMRNRIIQCGRNFLEAKGTGDGSSCPERNISEHPLTSVCRKQRSSNASNSSRILLPAEWTCSKL
jgi:hypothetical protein